MRRRERTTCILILIMVLVLLAGCLGSFWSVRTVPKRHYEAMVRAAEQMESCMAELKAERLRRGIPIDEGTDRFATGLLGTDFTAITTTLGNLEAKRTSCQPDMAALVCDLYVRAGVQAGDRVAICSTGSFPALNLAALCAAEALGAEPVMIVSIGASTYGANIPAFTAPEMLYHLYEAGLVATAPAGVTLGGDDDLGLNMGAVFFPDEAEALQAALDRMEGAGIVVTQIPDRQANLRWRESLYGDVSCFVSVGGHNMALGDHGEGYGLGQGLIEKPVTDGESYLMGHYLALGVPCIGLLNVKQLCAEYGIPFDPAALEKVGESHIYYEKAYPKAPLLGALAASMEDDHRIGYVAGRQDVAAIPNINAFALGAQLIDPYCKIVLQWIDSKPRNENISEGSVKNYSKQINMFSDLDMIRPEEPVRRYGVFELGENGEQKRIAAPIWNWGMFYELVVRKIMDGTYDSMPASRKDYSLNYWLGLESGLIDIILSDDLPRPAYRLYELLRKGVIEGRVNPFEGVIYDREGGVHGTEGASLTPAEIMSMDWLVENVCDAE